MAVGPSSLSYDPHELVSWVKQIPSAKEAEGRCFIQGATLQSMDAAGTMGEKQLPIPRRK